MPLSVSHILLTYRPELIYNKRFLIYNALTSCLTCINLTVNFALMCFFGQTFRDTIKYMFWISKDLPNSGKPNLPGILIGRMDRNNSIFQNLLNLVNHEDQREKNYLKNKRKSMPNIQNNRKKYFLNKENEEQKDLMNLRNEESTAEELQIKYIAKQQNMTLNERLKLVKLKERRFSR